MAAKRRSSPRKKAAPAASQGGDRGRAFPDCRNRPVWQGHLRLSLVSCPVALFNATSRSNDISFHLLNPETNNRIRMIPTDPDTGPVERSSLVKGYEIEKNRYVILSRRGIGFGAPADHAHAGYRNASSTRILSTACSGTTLICCCRATRWR